MGKTHQKKKKKFRKTVKHSAPQKELGLKHVLEGTMCLLYATKYADFLTVVLSEAQRVITQQNCITLL